MSLPTIAGVQSRIFTLPGRPPFMTVYDLAEFYEKTPKRIMEQMRRNIGRFPEGFIFDLTDAEKAVLITQNAASNRVQHGVLVGFTEKGALQLSSILTGRVADAVSVVIIEAFVSRRDGQLSALQRALFRDEIDYIGKSKMRLAIREAAKARWSFAQLYDAHNWSAPKLGREIEEMRLRGFIAPDALYVPPYVYNRRRAAVALMEAHAEDGRQYSLFADV